MDINVIDKWINEFSPEEQREEERREFNKKITPDKLDFFNNDPETQEFLSKYSNFVNKGEGNFLEINKMLLSKKRNPLFILYIKNKTDEMFENQTNKS